MTWLGLLCAITRLGCALVLCVRWLGTELGTVLAGPLVSIESIATVRRRRTLEQQVHMPKTYEYIEGP